MNWCCFDVTDISKARKYIWFLGTWLNGALGCWCLSSLIYVMAWCLISNKPLLKPVMTCHKWDPRMTPEWNWNKYVKGLEKQGKSEGFDSCDRPSNLKLDSNRQFFRPCDREIWWMTLQNKRQLFYATSSFVHHFVPIGEFKLKLQSGNAQSGSNWMIFRAVRPWNLTDDLAIQ